MTANGVNTSAIQLTLFNLEKTDTLYTSKIVVINLLQTQGFHFFPGDILTDMIGGYTIAVNRFMAADGNQYTFRPTLFIRNNAANNGSVGTAVITTIVLPHGKFRLSFTIISSIGIVYIGLIPANASRIRLNCSGWRLGGIWISSDGIGVILINVQSHAVSFS